MGPPVKIREWLAPRGAVLLLTLVTAEATVACRAEPSLNREEPVATVASSRSSTSEAPRSAQSASPLDVGRDLGIAVPPSGVLAPGAADALVARGAPPKVTLIGAGASPTMPLAYSIAKGAKVPMVVDVGMRMGMKSGMRDIPSTPLPRMKLSLLVAAVDVPPSADARIEAMVTDLSLAAADDAQQKMAAKLVPELSAARGALLSFGVSSSGRVRDVRRTPIATSTMEQLVSGIEPHALAMIVPLPVEPVDLGASWRAVSRVSDGGAEVLQDAVYTLVSRSGTEAVIDVRVGQVAASDAVGPAGLVGGATNAKVASFVGSGSGSQRIDMRSAVPLEGKLDLTTAMTVEVAPGAGMSPDRVRMESGLEVRLLRSEKEPP